MDESSFLASIENFFQTALNWQTPGNAVSPNPNGTPSIGNSGANFDTANAAPTVAQTGNWLSSVQGNYNSDFAFLTSSFNQAQSFATPLLSGISANLNTLGQGEIDAQKKYADALKHLGSDSGFAGLLNPFHFGG